MATISVATATVYLAEAQQAYHDLVTGRQARVVVDQNGERVEYTSANRTGLQTYIADLEAIIAGNTVTGPLKFFF